MPDIISYWSLSFSIIQELQECFESQDIAKLQVVIGDMAPEDAEYHMKRCVDSGLWVPDAKKAEKEKEEAEAKAAAVKKEEEESPYAELGGGDETSIDWLNNCELIFIAAWI